MKCPNCGKEVTEGKKFCGFCGNKIVARKAVTPEKEQKAETQELYSQPEIDAEKPIKTSAPTWLLLEIGLLVLFALLFFVIARMVVFTSLYLLIAVIAVLPTFFAIRKLQKAGLKTSLSSFKWQFLIGVIINFFLLIIILFLGNNWFIGAFGLFFLFVPSGIGLINSIINFRQKSTLIHAIISGLPMLIFVILMFLPVKIIT